MGLAGTVGTARLLIPNSTAWWRVDWIMINRLWIAMEEKWEREGKLYCFYSCPHPVTNVDETTPAKGMSLNWEERREITVGSLTVWEVGNILASALGRPLPCKIIFNSYSGTFQPKISERFAKESKYYQLCFRDWETEAKRWSDLPRITQLDNGRARNRIFCFLFPQLVASLCGCAAWHKDCWGLHTLEAYIFLSLTSLKSGLYYYYYYLLF